MVSSVSQSVCPSVRLSVTPFWLSPPHRAIMIFSGVITSDRSDVHAKGSRSDGQRSRSFRCHKPLSKPVSGLYCQVWIHVWWWNDAYQLDNASIKGTKLFLSSVKFQCHTALKISSEYGPAIGRFLDCRLQFELTRWLQNAARELEIA